MTSGAVSYSKPDLGNFGAYLGDKIKSAAKMAGEERKYAKEEAERQRKEGVSEDEIKKTGRGYFFGKALSHEFGGDLLRRTKGTFSTDPTKEQDPALSKAQRFSALVRGDVVAPQPFKQLELPLNAGENQKNAVQVEDKTLKSWLTVAFDKIQQSYDNIASKIGGLKTEEDKQIDQETKTTKTITKIVSGLQTVKSFFNKNNKLQEEENKTESEQLEFDLDAQNKEEMSQKETNLERGSDLSGSVDYSDPYAAKDDEDEDDGGGKRNLLDRMIDFGMDRRGRLRRKGFKRRYARRKFNNTRRRVGRGIGRARRGIGRGLGGARRGLGGLSRRIPRIPLSKGGIVPNEKSIVTPETSLVNNSIDKSKTVNQSTTNNNKVTNLAKGGIVDNPTKTILQPGQSVIPLNRNNPVANIFKQQKQKQFNKKDPAGKTMGEQLGTALQLPAQAAGGLLLSTMSGVFGKLGGVGKIFAPLLTQLFRPLAAVFGLPATVIGSLLGAGPASAATLDMKDLGDFLKGDKGKSNKKGGGGGNGGGGGGNDKGTFGPGMTAKGGAKASSYITSGFGRRSSPGGIGSTNHGGIDISGGPWVKGAAVSVIKPGTVKETGDLGSKGWGRYVVIKHDDGSYSLYGHLDQINVKEGEKINSSGGAATVIGKLGSTGASTGPHLHFELGTGWNGIIQNKVDPAPYVDNYVRGGGIVAVDGAPVTASSPGGTLSMQPGTTAARPSAKPSGSNAASNIFIKGGNTAAPPQQTPYLNAGTALSLTTANPSAPLYPSLW